MLSSSFKDEIVYMDAISIRIFIFKLYSITSISQSIQDAFGDA